MFFHLIIKLLTFKYFYIIFRKSIIRFFGFQEFGQRDPWPPTLLSYYSISSTCNCVPHDFKIYSNCIENFACKSFCRCSDQKLLVKKTSRSLTNYWIDHCTTLSLHWHNLLHSQNACIVSCIYYTLLLTRVLDLLDLPWAWLLLPFTFTSYYILLALCSSALRVHIWRAFLERSIFNWLWASVFPYCNL